jgi:hypothetical protein
MPSRSGSLTRIFIMNAALLAVLLSFSPSPQPLATSTPVTSSVVQDAKEEFEKRFAAAEGDVAKLWLVHNYCESFKLQKEDRKVLREILSLDPDHKGAREASGHIFYDDQWFKTEKKYEAYKAKKEDAAAKAAGFVKYKGEWVDPDDVERLEKGMAKDPDGNWVNASDIEFINKGFVRHDLMWISPEEVAEADAGKFKCGEEWKTESDANRYHSLSERFWKIPSYDGRFQIYTTADRSVALKALEEAASIVPDFVRVLGRVPIDPVVFALLRSTSQYGTFASGNPSFGVQPTELRGLSSVHGAYFGEVWFDTESGNHMGAGVAYWDASSDAGNSFGRLLARHAAALSLVEALDPSPRAIVRMKKDGKFDLGSFLSEKKLPDWLRYGTASYCERYYLNKDGGDQAAMRKWSVSNIRGGCDALSTIFKMNLTVDNPDQSAKLLNESGLVVSYMLDGDNAEVKAKHAAFKAAFKKGDPIESELRALEGALQDAETELRAFAGI